MNKLTLNSRLRDLYATPAGHDIVNMILARIHVNESVIRSPIAGSLRLATLKKLAGNKVSPTLFTSLADLCSSGAEEYTNLTPAGTPVMPAWWKQAVFYQVYPRTFCDSNGDGTGDIPGITSKLDYLHNLGITALWLSPVYDSPNDDNGYDIRDYQKILAEFGTMADFDTLLAECHKRSMRLIMDLVVNHTSDEHLWFKKALQSTADNPYRAYYFFRDGKSGIKPNNWTSFFSGSSWNYYPEISQYALHTFSKKQMDLNWDNPDVRSSVADMVNWWLDKGVDGFRMDVINFISKTPELPDGDATIGAMAGYYGIEKYIYGPHLHEYLRELTAKTFAPHRAFSVGETPALGMNMSRLLTDCARGELNMVFNFDVLESGGHARFDIYNYDLNYFRDYIISWMTNYGDGCWMSLFYDNHDNPRMISKIEKDTSYHAAVAKLLCAMQFTLRGTPFVYQGDEWGLPNHEFHSITEITDIESRNLYGTLLTKMDKDAAFAKICAGTREHARIPLAWTDTGRSAQSAKADVFSFYRQLIALKNSSPSLQYGAFAVLCRKKNRFVYTRAPYGGDTRSYLVECALSRHEVPHTKLPAAAELVASNYENRAKKLRAYEVNVYRV